MTGYLLSIDPGKSTGVTLWGVEDFVKGYIRNQGYTVESA
jgi:hypothetical protein